MKGLRARVWCWFFGHTDAGLHFDGKVCRLVCDSCGWQSDGIDMNEPERRES